MTPMYSSPHPYNDRDVDWNPTDGGGGNPYPNVGGGGNPYPHTGGGGNPYPHVGGGGGGYPPGYDAQFWGAPEPQGRRGGHHANYTSSYRPRHESHGNNRNDRSGDRREDAWDNGSHIRDTEAEDAARAAGWNVPSEDTSRRQRDHSPRNGGWGAEDDASAAGWGAAGGDWNASGRQRRQRDHSPHDRGNGAGDGGWGTNPEDWVAAAEERRSPRPRRRRDRSPSPADRDDRDPMGYYHHGRSRHTRREPSGWPGNSDNEEEGEKTWGQDNVDSWSFDDETHEGAHRGGGSPSGRHGSLPPPLMKRSHHGHRSHRSHHGHNDRRKHHGGPPSDAPPLGGPAGGPPRSSMKYRRTASADHLPRVFTYHGSSGTSYSTESLRAAMLQYGGAVPAATLRRSGTGLKKAMRWLKGPVATGNVALHPILRASTLLRPARLNWDDVTRLPLPTRGGIPISAGAGFGDAATSPPTAYMSLLIPIPGLPDGHWACEVLPTDLGSPGSPAFPGSPYAFPNVFSSFSGSPFPHQSLAGSPVPIVTTAALLLAVHTALQRRTTAAEFFALSAERQARVSGAFWRRCRRVGSAAEADAQARGGVRRLDFLGEKIKWEGLVPLELDQWLVRLGRP